MVIVGTYREWKHPSDPDALSTQGIKNQIKRLEEIITLIIKVKARGYPVIWGGDMNIDRNIKNDINLRADLKELTPRFDDLLNTQGLVVVNKELTWSRPGRRKSLLDLFVLDNPQLVMKCINVVNIMSEHAGVSMTINVALKKKNQQFITTRNFKNLTWENLEPKIQEEKSLNDLFATQDPNIVAENLLSGLNKIINKLAPPKRIQINKNSTPYWTSDLSASLK